MKTSREIFGQQITQFRKRAGLSVLDLSRKSGTSRQSIYDIEAGRLNVTADQFEKLLAACGTSMEQWISGLDSETLQGQIPRRYQDLFHMLSIIVESGDADLLHGMRVSLDAIAEKAMRIKKPPNESTDAGRVRSQAKRRA